MDLSDLQWGTVGEWASALGALGAIIVALRIANRENSAEAKRSTERAAEASAREARDRRRLADAVSVWYDSHAPNEWDVASFRVLNAGSLPITEVLIRHDGQNHEGDVAEMNYDLGTIAPGKIGDSGLNQWEDQISGKCAEIEFVDANGVRWLRTTEGALTETL